MPQVILSAVSKRAALGISLGAIALHWAYQLMSAGTPSAVPEHFGDLVLGLARNKLAVLAAIALLLRIQGQRFEVLGLHSRDWRAHLRAGLLIGAAMFVALNVVLTSVMDALIPRAAAEGPSVMAFFKQPINLLAWLPIGVIGGGLVEELERIFVLTRFEQAFGRAGLRLALILSSVIFGVGHLYQGVGAAISTAVSGLVFALVYLRRRSAVEPVVAHAFSDVLAMVAATLLAQ